MEEGTKTATPEMTPQEDGTKVPLTDGDPVVSIEEAKFVSNPNGDAKIDVEVPPAFSGLTKEELMKYSNDPFWVRLRWFLFILFWAGWLAMLIMAIVIIIQAPGCKPPPELLWVEEQPIVALDPQNLPTEQDLLDKCNTMGISSVYFPDLISNADFHEAKYDVQKLIDALIVAEKQAVTDLPSSIDPSNPIYQNVTDQNLVDSNGMWAYANENLPSVIFKEIVDIWISKGVKGFLMSDANSAEKVNFKTKLNGLAEEKGGAIGSDIVETKEAVQTPSAFKAFLEEHIGNFNFYKFQPNQALGSPVTDDHNLRLITIGLFSYLGTPMLTKFESSDNHTSSLIKYLSSMKSLQSIKFGNTYFANTTDDVIAFTRVYKGTPAYAIALNFNDVNTTVSFEGTSNVGDVGTVELNSKAMENLYDTREKINLGDIYLEPYEGLILQFVANF
ncbi:UNVERIFIED_CONTAM: hypothetical protein RMT77_018503 [Armadillidium vulgare]